MSARAPIRAKNAGMTPLFHPQSRRTVRTRSALKEFFYLSSSEKSALRARNILLLLSGGHPLDCHSSASEPFCRFQHVEEIAVAADVPLSRASDRIRWSEKVFPAGATKLGARRKRFLR
jgi:hypothetical protein